MGFFRRKEKRILIFGPQKGRFAGLMRKTLRGIDVAKEVFGSEGIKVISEDSGWSVDEVYSRLAFLLSRNKYDIIISPVFSIFAPSVSAAAEKYKIPLLLTVASVPFISKISKHVVALIYTDEDQAKAMVDFAKRFYYIDNITLIFYSKYRELSVIADAINKRALREGIRIKQIFKRGKEDISFDQIQVDWILKSDLVIVLGAKKTVSNVNRIIKESGEKIRLMSNDYLSVYDEEDLEGLDGVVHTIAYFPKEDLKGTAKEFLDTYTKKYGEKPNFISALAFDAYSVAWNALKDSSGKEELISKIKSGAKFPGSFGEFIIEESGRTRRKVLFVRIEKGKRIYEGGMEYE